MKRGPKPNSKVLRDHLVVYAYGQGHPLDAIAKAMKIDVVTICGIRKRMGVEGRGQGQGVNQTEGQCTGRWQEIAELFRSGKSMDAIGYEMNCSRERIRQILKKQGLKATDGGSHKAAERGWQLNSEERRRRYDEKAMKWFGCDWGQAIEINGGITAFRTGGSVTSAYFDQSRNAARRMIDFKLTLPEWWEIWQNSGQWESRGRGKGRYCMSRLGDVGCYEVGNVAIIKHEQNSADFYVHVNRKIRDELDLTPREREAYDLMVVGLTVKAISVQLGLKYAAAMQYVTHIRKRFPEMRKAA